MLSTEKKSKKKFSIIKIVCRLIFFVWCTIWIRKTNTSWWFNIENNSIPWPFIKLNSFSVGIKRNGPCFVQKPNATIEPMQNKFKLLERRKHSAPRVQKTRNTKSLNLVNKRKACACYYQRSKKNWSVVFSILISCRIVFSDSFCLFDWKFHFFSSPKFLKTPNTISTFADDFVSDG